jgi:hypothetical protein
MKKTEANIYADPAQDAAISNFEKEIIIYAETEGMHMGMQNKPDSQQGLHPFVKSIESKVQHLHERNHQAQLPIHGRVVASKLEAETKEKIQSLQPKFYDMEHQVKQLEGKKKELKPDRKKRLLRRCVHVVISFIAGTEGYFINESLRYASFPLLAAVVTASAVALGIGFGTHFFAGYILKAKTKLQKVIRYALILVPSAIFFYVIGHLRADAYNNIINLSLSPNDIVLPPSGGISAWNITLFSYIIFILSLFFSIWVYKSKEERDKEKQYEAVCDEIIKCEKSMQSIEVEINRSTKEAQQKGDEALERYEYAVATEKRLQAIAKQALYAFIEKNMRYRTDGRCPDCFSNPPAFQFTPFFNHIKNEE